MKSVFKGRLANGRKAPLSILHKDSGISKEIADSVDIVPTCYYERIELQPDGEYWMSSLWLKAFAACSSRVQPVFIRINEQYLNEVGTVKPQVNLQNDFLRD